MVCMTLSDQDSQPKVVGEVAHIVGRSDSGPRGNPDYPHELRNQYTNLIVLCRNHHVHVDKNPNQYTPSVLRKMKRDHENWVQTRLDTASLNIGFKELDTVVKRLVVAPSDVTPSFTLTPLKDKMEKNHLTISIKNRFNLGLSRTIEVNNFVEFLATSDPTFPDRLKAGFVEEYLRLRDEGEFGDDLFLSLFWFASGNSPDFDHQAAGLAVLVYLFEKCEVFEQ